MKFNEFKNLVDSGELAIIEQPVEYINGKEVYVGEPIYHSIKKKPNKTQTLYMDRDHNGEYFNEGLREY